MNRAFISIGSNIGDRLHCLVEAVRALHSHGKVKVLSVSSIYETEPVGYVDQADFLNLVIGVETELDAQRLLAVCQKIEHELGRVRDIRWGPRTVDLDILLYNNDNIEAENLIVPHPRMRERAFVLIPLLEIAPRSASPATGKPFSEEEVVGDSGVMLWKKVDGVEHFLLLRLVTSLTRPAAATPADIGLRCDGKMPARFTGNCRPRLRGPVSTRKRGRISPKPRTQSRKL